MLMVSNMCIKDSHLTTTNTCTHITHAVVVTNLRMLIIRIRIARLSCMPHDIIRILIASADQRTTTRGCNHLVAVERKHTETKGAQHLTIVTRAHSLCSILNHRNAILIGNDHNAFTIVRHAIERHRDYRLRIFARFLLTVNDSLLQ